MKVENRLLQLLKDIDAQKSSGFSGLGLITYRGDANRLPISSLKNTPQNFHLPIRSYELVLKFLVLVSNSDSNYHDGFHLLNENFELTHISQYVAPPILKEIQLDFNFGSRYRTAIYASFLNNVTACGVLSKNYSPTVFIRGRSI